MALPLTYMKFSSMTTFFGREQKGTIKSNQENQGNLEWECADPKRSIIWPNFKAVLSNLFSDLSCTSVACTLELVREVWEKAKCWESRYLSSTLNFATTIFYCLELGHATYILWSILYLFLAYKVNTRIVAPLTLCCYCEAIDVEQMCKINSALRMYHCFYQYD